MAHLHIPHPGRSLHLDHIHWEGWLMMLVSAAIIAFLVVAAGTGAEVTSLWGDPNIAA